LISSSSSSSSSSLSIFLLYDVPNPKPVVL
jgi:hypothetical protein